MKLLLITLVTILFAQTFCLPLDRNHPFQDLSKTNCPTTYYSACAVRNVHLLVTQVLQDINSTRFNADQFKSVFAMLNSMDRSYTLGDFTVAVFDGNMRKLADSGDNTTVGLSLTEANAKREIFTNPNLQQQYLEAAIAGGAWIDDTYFYYTKSGAVPTLRKAWVKGIMVNDSLYVAVSAFDNVDQQLVGRPCNSSRFADCALDVVIALVKTVTNELTYVIPSQLSTYLNLVSTGAKYKVSQGFAVTILNAADGTVLVHNGAGVHVGKKFGAIVGDQSKFQAILDAAAAGGCWVVHNWNEGGATFERQSFVQSTQPIDGVTYLILSGHGTETEAKCPPCVCPSCPEVPSCPLCPAITECDGVETTNLKLDFRGLI